MVQSVSYLHIKPLQTYRGDEKKGATTLLPFDTLLDSEQAAAGTRSTAESTENTVSNHTNTTTAVRSQEEAAVDNSVDKQIIYKDPVTGKNVTYIDVAGQAEEKESVSAVKNNTTSVDAMKKTKYDVYFKKAAKRYGVSESLLKAIAKAESNFNPKDVSSAGAAGIMQLMPATAKSLGVKNVYDPEQNIMGGAKCIKQKLKEFHGDVRLALAAYNAGSGAVRRNGGVPSYCKKYINKVLSYKEAYETARAVG